MRLDIGAHGASHDNALVVLVVILNLVKHISLVFQLANAVHGESIMSRLVSFAIKHTLAHKRVWTDVVGDHVGGIQRVKVQHGDGLIQIHANLWTDDDGTLVSVRTFIRFLRANDLVALGGIVDDCAKDFDALSPPKHIVHGNLTDIRHASRIDQRVQFRHEREHQVAVLNTVSGNAGTVCGRATMKGKQFMGFHVVLGEAPFQRLYFCGREFSKQSVHALDTERLGCHIEYYKLCSFAIRVCRVADNIKPNIVAVAQSTGALGINLNSIANLFTPQHLVAQKHGGHIVQFETVQTVFATHVEQQVQSQTTPQHHVSQVILAGRQLKLFGLTELGPERLAVLCDGYASSHRHFAKNAENATPVLNVGIVKTKGVVSAHYIWVVVPNVPLKPQEHFLFTATRYKRRVLLVRRVYRSIHKHGATDRIQHVVRPAIRHANLNDGVTACLREQPRGTIHFQIIGRHKLWNGNIWCGFYILVVNLVERLHIVFGFARLPVHWNV